ncbi:aconitate hydratase [Blattabacterium cuenoti]|uniref:aconitate hydratase n=1 Tax=Blattabacterium cuenoti TaxID=1653831 RepID=UPI00163C3EEE|nr:aconitate hydratase [Blattabacterium cuenoti]
MLFDFDKILNFYSNLKLRFNKIRNKIRRPMTFSEKILYSHLLEEKFIDYKYSSKIHVNESYLKFLPDRLAMQDATAQMTILQFMLTGKNKTIIPTTIHCDHLIKAKEGKLLDLEKSIQDNKEIYNFLLSASHKYGIGFWKPGSGIIHQIILENYAFPGGMMIGTDSHTPNAGGLGMLAIGVGGLEAVEVMSGYYLELKIPKIIGVLLKGKLNGWTSPKDIILKLSGIMGGKGAKGCIIEYFGEGIENLSCTGKATICNMGAEIGATSSLFPYDTKMKEFLEESGRKEISEEISNNKINNFLKADIEVYQKPWIYYDKLIEINLNVLEPHINGPFTPDRSIPISHMKKEAEKNNWPIKIEAGLIGSCTNSSYEDLSKAASIIQQAKKKKLKVSSEYLITPGSYRVYHLIEKDGLISLFKSIGAKIFSNACGPCIGQWIRKGDYKKNTIIHSFNRNFSSRNDGNPETYAFIASPEIVTALSISGYLTFDPRKDHLKNEEGKYVKLEEPKLYIKNPSSKKNFSLKELGYEESIGTGINASLKIDPHSKRLQMLSLFSPWDKKDLLNVRLLIKVKGKCTTDHISMAGPWLQYRGHIENISENLLIGAINSFNNKINHIKNVLTGNYGTVPNVAKFYKYKKIPTIIVGEENYGEGSSREHAAMEPRYLGVRIVLAKSFSRIHEVNLKKQGILAVNFLKNSDYHKIKEDDTLHFYIKNFYPKKNINVELVHKNGKKEIIIVQHSYNLREIEWFTYGSSLNFIRKKINENFQ